MMTEEKEIISLLKSPMQAFRPEELVVEAIRELVKEEIKTRIRKALDSDERLRADLKKAVADLMDARVREVYAMVAIGKCGAELGLKLVPEELKEKMEREIATLLAKEAERVIDRIEKE